MLSQRDFNSYKPGYDRFANFSANLVLDNLLPRFEGKPKLSIMISTWNRQHQLSRSLECLARQEWREFEVMIMDNGSTQDLSAIFSKFEPYLQLKTYRRELPHWTSCPSWSFQQMLKDAQGEVIAITHPEMMLHSSATWYLYHGVDTNKKLGDCHYKLLEEEYDFDPEWFWVSFKPLFISDHIYAKIDAVDWHTDVHNLRLLPNFWNALGLSNRPNIFHYVREGFPWWFVGSAKRECPIWDDMPTTDGHGLIDMWMLAYRGTKKIVDVVPDEALCYHQAHLVHAVAPEGEQVSEKMTVK
jgi:glycosyltransferase involved in cell wall biosynthesis